MDHLQPRWRVVAAMFAVVAMVAACTSDDGDDVAEEPAAETDHSEDVDDEDEVVEDEPDADNDAEPEAADGVDLSSVCPETVVIQLDWEPESEHGAIYELIGDEYTIDADAKSVTGPLMASGEPTGVDVEIRVGGRPIGFQDAQSLLYQDPDILLGFGRVGEMMTTQDELPVTGVMATMEKSPYSVYWDPETYPDVSSIEDLGEEGVTILVGPGTNVWVDWFVAEGIWTEGQVDRSESPKPASFVAAGGAEAEAGFATAEPFMYEFELPDQWGRPVEIALLHEAGFPEYFQVLVTRADDIEAQAYCFELLVPVMQQAGVDYVDAPDATHELVLELVDAYDTGWIYTPELADFAYTTHLELGIMSNGTDGAFGSFDIDRIGELAEIVSSVSDFDADTFDPEGLVTNRFIDPEISLP